MWGWALTLLHLILDDHQCWLLKNRNIFFEKRGGTFKPGRKFPRISPGINPCDVELKGWQSSEPLKDRWDLRSKTHLLQQDWDKSFTSACCCANPRALLTPALPHPYPDYFHPPQSQFSSLLPRTFPWKYPVQLQPIKYGFLQQHLVRGIKKGHTSHPTAFINGKIQCTAGHLWSHSIRDAQTLK